MESSAEALPEYDHVLFRRAPLVLCIVQVKYPPIPGFSSDEIAQQFLKVFKREYPFFAREQTMGVMITPSGVNQSPVGTSLRFNSVDKAWSVVIGEDFVSLESRRYAERSELSRRFTRILKDVAQVLQPTHQTRFGLRYINEIRHPDGEEYEAWKRLLNADLLGLAAHNAFGGVVEHTINELRVRRTDGNLLIRHGFLRGTTVGPVSGRPPESGPFYLLDTDFFDETVGEFRTDGSKQLAAYIDVLYRIFRWAVGNGELYQYLGGE